MLPTVFSCGAVVYRKASSGTEILLVKQFENDKAWGIPKGHMEDGETYTETAIREVREEAGIDINIITQLPHVFITRKYYRKIVVPFLALQACDNVPTPNHAASEVVDVSWFNVRELPSIYYYQRPIIDAALLLLKINSNE